MSIETRRFDSVEAFLDVCGPFLEAREPEHQLTLGIVGDAQAHGGFPDDGALVAALQDGRVMATAIWTPPWNVILSEVDDEQALPAIADSLAAEDLGGVNGPAEHVEAFARAWCRTDGRAICRGNAPAQLRPRHGHPSAGCARPPSPGRTRRPGRDDGMDGRLRS